MRVMARPKRRGGALTPAQKRQYQHLVQAGWDALTSGDLERAEREFREATQLAPHRGEAWHGLGVTRYQQGNPSAAYDALRKAVHLSPHLAEAWFNLAHVADTLGYTLEAHDAAQEALNQARRQGYPESILSGMEQVARALHQAIQRLAEELGLSLHSEEDLRRLRRSYRAFQEGIQAAQQGDFATAAAAFQRAVEDGAESARTWGNLGVALLMLRELDRAEAALRRALELNPNYTPAQQNLQLLSKVRENPNIELDTLLHGYTDTKFNAPKRDRLK